MKRTGSLYLIFVKKLAKPTRKFERLVLLILLFVVYLFCGAYIHQQLNYSTDVNQQKEVIDYLTLFLENNSKCINETDLQYIYSIIDNAMQRGLKFNINSLDNRTLTPSWEFGGEALFFTFTLLATIGYGHLAPTTNTGKIFCIFYLTFGVPMTSLLMQSIVDRIELSILTRRPKKLLSLDDERTKLLGEEISKSNSYQSITQVNCVIPSQRSRKINYHYYKCLFIVFIFLIIFVYVLPSYLAINISESWSFLDAIYYFYISITTIGFGDFVPGTDRPDPERDYYRLIVMAILFFAMITNMLFLNLLVRLPFLRDLTCEYSHIEDDDENESTSSMISESISNDS